MSAVGLTLQPREAQAASACYNADACTAGCPTNVASWCDYYLHFLHCIASGDSYCYRDTVFCPENLSYCYDPESGDGNPNGPYCTPDHVVCIFQ